VFGAGSPKFGSFQRRVVGMATDLSARSTITPNPRFDMDEVGLPEEQAWTLFKPFVMRSLVREGTPATSAAKMIENRDKRAADALVKEMDARPIIITRAPALHKYNIMAVRPKLVKGSSLQISPIVTGPFTADFDGDSMSYHVPVSKKAVDEAYAKMLPSKNLRSAADFNIHYAPGQEYQYGLYRATKPGVGKKPAQTFDSIKSALDAYRRGELAVEDEVIIHDTGKKL
jgi:DNA-directed RNA polymerase subunit beta'